MANLPARYVTCGYFTNRCCHVGRSPGLQTGLLDAWTIFKVNLSKISISSENSGLKDTYYQGYSTPTPSMKPLDAFGALFNCQVVPTFHSAARLEIPVSDHMIMAVVDPIHYLQNTPRMRRFGKTSGDVNVWCGTFKHISPYIYIYIPITCWLMLCSWARSICSNLPVPTNKCLINIPNESKWCQVKWVAHIYSCLSYSYINRYIFIYIFIYHLWKKKHSHNCFNSKTSPAWR